MENLDLPDGTHLGTVYLRVRELERSLAFYRDLLGLRVVPRVEGVTYLAAALDGPALLGLVEHPDAPPRPPRTIGLYHFALLLPERLDLARAVHRIMDHRWQIQGASDHSVSEAVYLADRIAVMSARPGPIKTIVDNKLDRTDPNLFKSQVFAERVDDIWNLVREEAMKMQGARTS